MAKKKTAKRKKAVSLKSRVLALEAKVGMIQADHQGMHSLLMTLNQSNINSWAVLRALMADFDNYVRLNPGIPSPIPPQG